MIRRALNGMWGVGIMSVVALVLLYVNIVAPLLKTDSEQPSLPVVTSPVSSVRDHVDGKRKEKRFGRFDRKQVHWVDRINRDPFSLHQAHATPLVKPVVEQAKDKKSAPVTVAPVLTLRAIAVEGAKRTAVINRTIVREGDGMKGFRVISIRPDGVWLQEGHRRRFLTFKDVPHPHETS